MTRMFPHWWFYSIRTGTTRQLLRKSLPQITCWTAPGVATSTQMVWKIFPLKHLHSALLVSQQQVNKMRSRLHFLSSETKTPTPHLQFGEMTFIVYKLRAIKWQFPSRVSLHMEWLNYRVARDAVTVVCTCEYQNILFLLSPWLRHDAITTSDSDVEWSAASCWAHFSNSITFGRPPNWANVL